MRAHSENCICGACRAYLRKLRREAERPRRVPAEDVPARTAILRARAAGFTFREIADQVGVSTATVYRLSRGGAMVDPKTQAALEGVEFVEAAG
jgi:Homeodomain-like domain-containing protein